MACHGQHERDGVESKAVYFLFSKGVKDDNKSRKVSFGPVSILYISENGDRYDSFLVFPSSESDRQSHRSIQRILVLKSNACKTLAAAVGAYVVPGARLCLKRFQFFLNRVWNRGLHPKDLLVPVPLELKEGLAWWLVKKRLEKGLSPVHRRVQGEMGSNPRSVSSLRFLEQGGVKGAYQQARVTAIFYALQNLQDVVSRKTGQGSQTTPLLSLTSGSRGNKVMGTVPFSGRPVSLVGREECYSAAQICAGQKQHCSGHLEPEGTCDLTEWILNSQVCRMLWRVLGCPLGDTFATSMTKRLDFYFAPHLDPNAPGVDAFLQPLLQLGSVCFSSFCPHSKSDNQVQSGKELLIDSCSFMVASEEVVPRSIGSSSGLPKGPSAEVRSAASTSRQCSSSRSPHSSSDRLETILRQGR